MFTDQMRFSLIGRNHACRQYHISGCTKAFASGCDNRVGTVAGMLELGSRDM